MKENTSERLKKIMEIRNLKQIDIVNLAKPFCEKYNIKLGRNDLSQYVSGKVEPTQNKLLVLSKALDVNIAWLMGLNVSMQSRDTIRTCPICDFSYCPNIKKDVDMHNKRHIACLEAIKKYGFWWNGARRGEIKGKSDIILSDPSSSKKDKIMAAENICKTYFCRCLQAWNFEPRHPSFEKYTSMLLKQDNFKKRFYPVYKELVDKYGVSEGIEEGTYITDEKFLDDVTENSDLEENVIIYHRNGEVIRKKMSKEKIDMLAAMIDAIPEEDNPDI